MLGYDAFHVFPEKETKKMIETIECDEFLYELFADNMIYEIRTGRRHDSIWGLSDEITIISTLPLPCGTV